MSISGTHPIVAPLLPGGAIWFSCVQVSSKFGSKEGQNGLVPYHDSHAGIHYNIGNKATG